MLLPGIGPANILKMGKGLRALAGAGPKGQELFYKFYDKSWDWAGQVSGKDYSKEKEAGEEAEKFLKLLEKFGEVRKKKH